MIRRLAHDKAGALAGRQDVLQQVGTVDVAPDLARGVGGLFRGQVRQLTEVGAACAKGRALQHQETLDVPPLNVALGSVQVNREIKEVRHDAARLLAIVARGLQNIEPFENKDVRLTDLEELVGHDVVTDVGIHRRADFRRARLEVREKLDHALAIVAFRKALAVHDAVGHKPGIGVQKTVGGDQIDPWMIRPARHQGLQHPGKRALAHRDAAGHRHYIRLTFGGPSQKGVLDAVQIARRADVQIDQARQRQVNVGDILKGNVLVHAPQCRQIFLRQRQWRTGTQPRPLRAAHYQIVIRCHLLRSSQVSVSTWCEDYRIDSKRGQIYLGFGGGADRHPMNGRITSRRCDENPLWRQPHQPHPGTQCSRCGCCLPALTRFTGNRCGGTDGVTITTLASGEPRHCTGLAPSYNLLFQIKIFSAFKPLSPMRLHSLRTDYGTMTRCFRLLADPLLKRPGARHRQGFVLLIDELPRGFFLLKRRTLLPDWALQQSDVTTTLHALMIDRRFQGQGLGKRCLQALPELTQALWPDTEQLMLAVDAGNHAARELYRAQGWQELPEREAVNAGAECEALNFVAAQLAEDFIHGLGLCAFCDDAIAQALGQIDDGLYQAPILLVAVDIFNQGFVQLDRGGRQLPQVGPVAVAGAEVVDGDVDRDELQRTDRPQHRVLPTQQGFDGNDPPRRHFQPWLIHQRQLIRAAHRLGQRSQQQKSALLGEVQVRLVPAPADGLAAGFVRRTDHQPNPVALIAALKPQRQHADADVHLDRDIATHQRPPKMLKQLPEQPLRLLRSGIAGDQRDACRADLVECGVGGQLTAAVIDHAAHQFLGEAVAKGLDDTVEKGGGDHVQSDQRMFAPIGQRAEVFFQTQAVEQPGGLVNVTGVAQVIKALHHQLAIHLQHGSVALIQQRPGLGADDAQRTQRQAIGRYQGHAGVKADMRLTGDQRVVAEAWVEHRVRDLERLVTEDGVGAEGDFARGLPLLQACAGPEPLTDLIRLAARPLYDQMDEVQLGDDGRRQHERIEVRLSHGTGQLVEHAGQLDPGIDEGEERRAAWMLGVVVRPGFGPVFPGVHGGVGADVMLLPVGRGTVLIMMVQGIGVAGAVVAEQVAEAVLPVGVGDQAIPIVMTHFMTEMPEQCAVGFVHLHAHLLTDGVVGFFDIEGDQAIGVAGGGQVALDVDAKKLKRQTAFFVDAFGDDLQAQGNKLRHQSTFGGLDFAPALGVLRHGQVGDGLVEAAGDAEITCVECGENPVTGRCCVEVRAATVEAGLGFVTYAPGLRVGPRFQRGDFALLRQIAQRCRACQALAVAEEHRLSAPALPDFAVAFALPGEWRRDPCAELLE
nr:hypothetical protein [Tanacetum cinerariifolium]